MLKIDTIKESILKYVFDERKKQAVLLNGEWGCGKTFFVKNYLIPSLEENEKAQIFKISLYGISSIDIIQEMIYAQWIELNMCKISSKLWPIGQIVGAFGKSAIRAIEDRLGAEGAVEKLTTSVLDNAINKNSYNIIIFDDIERCKIDIIQLMGFLNNLSENYGFKLILVANEKEIKYKDNPIEEALKYLVVLQNQGQAPMGAKGFGSSWSKDELKDAILDIFNEKSVYEITREKLVGLTVLYRISISEIFESVAQNCIKKEYTCKKVIDNMDSIIKLFDESNHGNIRTLISACIVIEDMVNIICENINIYDNAIDKEINTVIQYTVYSAIRRATGEELFEWTFDDTRYGCVNNNSMDSGIYGYAFIDEYWKTHYIDKDTIVEDIKDKIAYCEAAEEFKKNRKKINDLSLRKLMKWYLLEDEEVNKLIKKMKEELDNEEYQPYEFKDIICTLININNPSFGMNYERNTQQGGKTLYNPMEVAQFEGIELEQIEENSICNIYSNWDNVDINEFVQSMVLYFDNTSYRVTKDMINILSSDKQFIYKYRVYMKPLIDAAEKYELEENTKVYTEYNGPYISDLPWDDSFKEKLMNRKEKYIDQGRFLYFFNYKKLIKRILDASPCEIHNFCDTIEGVYKNSNPGETYPDDLNMVNEVGKFIDDNFKRIVDKRKSRTMEIALNRLKALFIEYRKDFGHVQERYSGIRRF